ncbi:MAG: non-canonical purine NTP diphosphatase [Muribaculaceae bacterium]|nr:non-canonical purine NTP diphosphatase [Paludibacteraceae bacterium]MBR4963551.1 non-canonical purine NTP diphosphatase [Muribaculaceae bacterium]
MRKLVFATNNKHKLEEARKILEGMVEILSLSEIGCNDDIPETATTLEGNALIKARYIKEHYGYDCFADDTGLLVDALDGAPGVYSARYAGEECNPQKNMEKLLSELEGIEQRAAAFVTCVALTLRGSEHIFMGEIAGEITKEAKGNAGFGYDPIFKPFGYDKTFAELGDDIKNSISHRAKAMEKLAQFLNNLID